nr:hypothetical protein B0A51_03181 [Rachicladosporium sp. CCFEE 5018]
MVYELDDGTRRRVGRSYREAIRAAYDRHNANRTQYGSPSNREYSTTSGSGHPSGRAVPRSVLRSSDGDNDPSSSQSGSNDSGDDDSSTAQSQDNARTPDRGPSPPPRSTGTGNTVSPAALERRRLLTRLMRERGVPVGDAMAVADLVERGHEDDAAIKIHALMKSGQAYDAAVRISKLMNNSHRIVDVIAIADLIEEGHDDDTAVQIHALMQSGHDHDAAVRISELVDDGQPGKCGHTGACA